VTNVLNKVGTRIELQRATIIGNPTPGGTLFVSLTMVNTGYGRVVRARPATVVLTSSGTVVAQLPIGLQNLDLRQLAASSPPTPQTFQFTVTLPSSLPSGPVSASLLVPDPAPSLSSQAAYALPFNSVDQTGRAIFNSTTGYNAIGSFTAGAGNQTQSAPFVVAAPSFGLSELTGTWAGDGPVGAVAPGTFTPMQVGPSLRAALASLRGTPRIAWTLAQSGTTVNGAVSVTLQGAPMLTGTLVGTFVNRMLTYTVQVPAGAVPFAPDCSGQIEGIVNVTDTTLVGTASPRASTCASPLSVVNFALTKQ
jgi:hypothetical protein